MNHLTIDKLKIVIKSKYKFKQINYLLIHQNFHLFTVASPIIEQN